MREKMIEVFDGVNWGTQTVLDETFQRLIQKGAKLELLPVWYDVDRLDDLRFLKIHLEILAGAGQTEGISTRKFLSNLPL